MMIRWGWGWLYDGRTSSQIAIFCELWSSIAIVIVILFHLMESLCMQAEYCLISGCRIRIDIIRAICIDENTVGNTAAWKRCDDNMWFLFDSVGPQYECLKCGWLALNYFWPTLKYICLDLKFGKKYSTTVIPINDPISRILSVLGKESTPAQH